jgi:uncharacterized membrane protein
MTINALLIALHALLAVLWVGGMAFAYMVLRPAVDAQEPAVKMTLLAAVFRRFFIWVWHAIVVLPITGYVHHVLPLQGFCRLRPATSTC